MHPRRSSSEPDDLVDGDRRRSSLADIGVDCIWEICLYSAKDYGAIAALSRTCSVIYLSCNEEFIWQQVASEVIPNEAFRALDARHKGLLTSARAEERRRFRAHVRAGIISPDTDESYYLGIGDLTDMNRYMPRFFQNEVRAYALRAVTRNIQMFVEAAMAVDNATVTLTHVKKRESDLRSYFSTARDIAFRQSCIGRSGAMLLASSLALCTGGGGTICHLSRIDLSGQLIRDQGAESLLAAIVGSRSLLQSLRYLGLSNNKLSDAISVWLGNFIQQSVSRGGALQELSLDNNPNLTETTLIEVAFGLERALFGDDGGDLGGATKCLQTPQGLRDRLADCNDPQLSAASWWASIPFRCLSMHATHVGRSREGLGAKKVRDLSAAPPNSPSGRTALCELLGCFALICSATSAVANADVSHCGGGARRGETRSKASVVRVHLQDCGFDKAVVAACVSYLATAWDPQNASSVDGSRSDACSIPPPACVFSADFGERVSEVDNISGDVKDTGNDDTPQPNNPVSPQLIEQTIKALPPAAQAGVQVLTAGNDNDVPHEEQSSRTKVVIGRSLMWEVVLPSHSSSSKGHTNNGGKKGSGCVVM